MQRKNRHGIVLITTMLFVTVIVMIATLIASQGKMALLSGTASMQSEEAYMAALSGIDFVRGELKKDKSFGTYSLSGYKKKVPSSPVSGFFVNYNNNDLTGYIGANSKDDYKSKFSVSFKDNSVSNHGDTNYKHTSSACKYLSVNNVNSTFQIDKDMSKGVRRDVPPYSMYIVSKGVCGKSVRYVEAFVTSNGPSAVDNGTTIGGDINIKGSKNTDYTKDENYLLNIYHVDDKYPGQINAFDSDGKCTKDVNLTAGNCDVEKLLNLKNKVTINGNFDKSKIKNESSAKNLSVSQTAVIDTANLNDLSMQDAKGNIDNNLSSFSLDPGSYVYLRDFSGDEMKAKWVYVNEKELGAKNASNTLINAIKNENFTDILSKPDIASNTAISFGKSDIAGFQSRTVTVNGNVNVTDNVNFVVIDKFSKNKYSMETSTVDFQLNKGSIVSENGSINIRGEVVGNGNLIAGKNIDINAGSSLEVDKDQKVTIYAEEDININRAKNLSNKSLRRQFGNLLNQVNSNSTSGATNQSTGQQEPIISDEQMKRLELGLVADDVDSTINTNEETGSSSFTTDLSNVGITCTPVELTLESMTKTIDKLYDLNINGEHYLIPCLNTKTDPKISIIAPETPLITKEDEGDWTVNPNLNFVYGNRDKCCSLGFEIDNRNFYISHAKDTYSNKDFNLFVKENENYYFCGKLDFSNNNDNPYSLTENKDQYDLSGLSGYTKDTIGTYDNLKVELAKSVNEQSGNSSNNATLTDSENAPKTLSDNEKQLASDIYVSKTSLIGTVYSKKGNININIGATAFDILGALITCDGDLDITASKVNLTYDPDYVPFFKDTGIQTKLRFLSSFIGGE